MNTIKNTLIIVLSLSCHAGIMSMQPKHYLVPRTESGKHALQILKFAQDKDNEISLKSTGEWLMKYRNSIGEEQRWHELVKQFLTDIETVTSQCKTPLERLRLSMTKNAISEIAYPLKPGEDCLETLLSKVETIKAGTSKY